MPRIRLLALSTLICSGAHAELRYDWADDFSAPEQIRLVEWIERTSDGLESLSGPLPFDIRVRFQRSDNTQEPVPWANTVRSPGQGVRFVVNPAFPPDSLLADWTAPHELSHLLIPYLGRRHAWFAEGFASYMQYQVMYHMGVLDWPEVVNRYRRQMTKARGRYDLPALAFATAAPRLRSAGDYPTMYWGGAVLFLRVDSRLRQTGDASLGRVIGEYVACCRMETRDLAGLIRTLDQISGTSVFSDEYDRFVDQPGFPAFEPALAALGDYRAAGGDGSPSAGTAAQ
ncbi:MAG: hypothetical protein PVG91_11520 [Gammaproteobacteria bacterium]|jgi:hypothetical protein